MKKFKIAFFLISISILNCQNEAKSPITDTNIKDHKSLSNIDTSRYAQDSLEQPRLELALTSNGLQILKLPSGSTTELEVGMGMEKVLEVVSSVLMLEIPELQVNSECGSGPMNMAVFENGLVLMFQTAKSKEQKLEFVGWSVSEKGYSKKLTTMANIGIGSTRAELESAYHVEIKETSLGIEFSTIPGGLYGLIDGPSEGSKINFIWSGLSCNFR